MNSFPLNFPTKLVRIGVYFGIFSVLDVVSFVYYCNDVGMLNVCYLRNP